MSAWAEIVYADNSDAWTGMCSRALDEIRDEVALDLGRDLLRDGLDAFLRRLVGPENAARVLADIRREDAATVRAAKLREPHGYDDGRLNRALERVAQQIEKGPR